MILLYAHSFCYALVTYFSYSLHDGFIVRTRNCALTYL